MEPLLRLRAQHAIRRDARPLREHGGGRYRGDTGETQGRHMGDTGEIQGGV